MFDLNTQVHLSKQIPFVQFKKIMNTHFADFSLYNGGFLKTFIIRSLDTNRTNKQTNNNREVDF